MKCSILLCIGNTCIDYPLIPVTPGLFCCIQKKVWSVSVPTLFSTYSISSCFFYFLLWLSHGYTLSHVTLSKGGCCPLLGATHAWTSRSRCPVCFSLLLSNHLSPYLWKPLATLKKMPGVRHHPMSLNYSEKSDVKQTPEWCKKRLVAIEENIYCRL